MGHSDETDQNFVQAVYNPYQSGDRNMARKQKQPNRVDELLDELLADRPSPEEILGESGLLK